MSMQLGQLLPMLPVPEIDVDQEEFRDWLEARRFSIVGVSCEDGSCPVSNYLTDLYKKHYFVSADSCGTYDVPASHILPSWLSAFVCRLDFVQSYAERPISGAQALEVYEWAISHFHLLSPDEDTVSGGPAVLSLV